MKVKIFDFEHEEDLEKNVNEFISDKDVINISYQASHFNFNGEQIFSFSCLIQYNE
ncbi:MAG: sporulation protein Cse60 [Erysipelotrichaceae bacterium]|nr:sporulation protein Cse60 [Erysipelotrichaceae bacterium]